MIRPLSDNVLIALEKDDEVSPGGIHIVQNAKSAAYAHTKARVLAVGPGHFPACRTCGSDRGALIATRVKPGDRVIVGGLAGDKYSFQIDQAILDAYGASGEVRMCREAEIIAVIESSEVREGRAAAE